MIFLFKYKKIVIYESPAINKKYIIKGIYHTFWDEFKEVRSKFQGQM